jgi:hypothetical protein
MDYSFQKFCHEGSGQDDQESERIQDEWIAEDRKLVNGTPIKYGKDVDGKTIVQRFAFLNQFEIFQNSSVIPGCWRCLN